jgi:cytochrome c556
MKVTMMRWSGFLVIQCLIVLAIVGVVYFHQDNVIVIKEPPESIAQWYKPQNKRQVWLHTMFKLRREMVAIEIYAKSRSDKNLQKWVAKLNEDYREIAEMVPEWQTRLDLATVAELQKAIDEQRYGDVTLALLDLDDSCQSCHADFRAVTATMYRAPDFSTIEIEGSLSLIAQMRTMSKQINRIKIAFADNRQEAALAALSNLEKEMNSLGAVCVDCHDKTSETYPNEEMSHAMTDLEQSLKTRSLQDQGKALGTLAVMACAECHGTHRLVSDAKRLLTGTRSWGELLEHGF